jgi:hypothetical protein
MALNAWGLFVCLVSFSAPVPCVLFLLSAVVSELGLGVEAMKAWSGFVSPPQAPCCMADRCKPGLQIVLYYVDMSHV